MVKAATARTPDTESDPIDRLEEKVKRLVDMIAQLRTDLAQSADANDRLTRELTTLRGRLAESEHAAGELTALRDEREAIRARVADMLQQLEGI